jgi:glutamate-ammonia-ligase adenylyltransferase
MDSTSPALRTGNTQRRIARLEHVGCLNNLDGRSWGRTIVSCARSKHRLQILFDLQTHLLPEQSEELRKLALRWAMSTRRTGPPWRRFTARLPDQDRPEPPDPGSPAARRLRAKTGRRHAESDLVLDPNPPEERVVEVLGATVSAT